MTRLGASHSDQKRKILMKPRSNYYIGALLITYTIFGGLYRGLTNYLYYFGGSLLQKYNYPKTLFSLLRPLLQWNPYGNPYRTL